MKKAPCHLCLSAGKPAKVYLKNAFTSHMRNWHDMGTFLCVCGASFDLAGQLTRHKKIHHSSQSCPQCGKVIKCLKRHMRDVHEDKEVVVCPLGQCKRSFLGMAQLLAHVRHTHGNAGQKFVCHLCSKEVANKLNLKQHIRRQHYEVRNTGDFLPCPECGKAFPSNILLNGHQKRVHVQDQRKCSVCNNKYKNMYSLKKHMKKCNFNTFECDVCSCAYKSQFRLSKHMVNSHVGSLIQGMSSTKPAPNLPGIDVRDNTIENNPENPREQPAPATAPVLSQNNKFRAKGDAVKRIQEDWLEWW